MKQILLSLIFSLALTTLCLGQTTVWTLDFESDGGYTTTPDEFNDNSSDFFTRTEGSDISSSYEVSNIQGSYFFAVQDIDGDQDVTPVVLTIEDIDISNLSNLQFSILLAEDDDDGKDDWDSGDFVHIDYDIDNSGNFSNLLWIQNDGSRYNSAPFIDTDFDGIGDGTEITSTFTEFSAAIQESGSSIDIRITFQLESKDEDIAIDQLTITADGSSPSNTTVAFASSSETVSETVDTYNLTLNIANEDATTATQCEVSLTSGDASNIGNFSTQSITFDAGSSNNQTIALTITDDADYTGDKTLVFSLQNVSGGNSAEIGSLSTFTLTIQDDEWPNATLPYSEEFDDCNSQLWQEVSLASTRDWSCSGNGYMSINAFGGDEASDDYLVSPAFNLDNYNNEILSFSSYSNYSDTNYPPIEILYSTDFSGDVTTATWNTLSATWSEENSSTWTSSEDIDISAIVGTNVYFAFHYTSTGTGSGTSSLWEIDNISITGTEATVINEPDNHVMNFSATTGEISDTSIALSWTENDGDIVPDGYLIKASTEEVSTPVDGEDITEDTDLTDNSGAVKVNHGTTNYTFTNCKAGTTYNFAIYPFTGTGETIDYKTDTVPTTSATTNSTTIDVVEIPVFHNSDKTIYLDSVVVDITCATAGAEIHYTLGSDQPDENSPIYDGNLVIKEDNVIITVVAILNGVSSYITGKKFQVVTANTELASPTVDPETGDYYDSVTVALSAANDATILYALNGDVSTTNQIKYTTPLTFTENTSISAIAVYESSYGLIMTADYTITISDSITVAPPMFSPATGEYNDSVVVSITCATNNATIYYTTNGDEPTQNSTQYNGEFILYENTTVKAIAYIENTASEINQVTYTINKEEIPVEVTTIADLRASNTDETIYSFTGEAVVTFAQDYRNQKYIQDETGAVLIDDYDGIITSEIEKGDKITNISGTLYDYSGMLEFVPISDAEVIDSNITTTPVVVDITTFTNEFESYEAKLITIEQVYFNQDITFENGTNYTITDANSNETILRSHFYDVDYIGTTYSSHSYNVTGIALWHYDEAKIVPRNSDDIEFRTSVDNITDNLKIYAVNHEITIKNAANYSKVAVYNSNGQIIRETTIDNQASINIPKSGIYVVVLSGENITSQKVMIK